MNANDPAMNPDAQREAALFQAAAQLTGAARASFLDSACHGNPDLRQRLEALLAAHEQSQGVFAEPAPGSGPTMKVEFVEEFKDEGIGSHIGPYKLREKVGEGGCGVVYVAEQEKPVRRRVALKVIKLGMDTKAVIARFEAERQALAIMDHPSIAKVLDAGTTEIGRPYFVMELVRGIRITEYCDQNNLTTRERLELFIKICQAIQHAHQKGIIHRDIKPSNILVTLHDGVPVPKVIDFGIAKATEGRLTDATVYTQLHQFIGTPAYMSPEQAEMSGLDVDTRSDIYSLGVLFYELLTGKTPFDATELMSQGIDAMRKTIRDKEAVRPSTKLATLHADELTTTAKRRSTDTSKLMRQLRGDLDWIVMKCLEKDRTRRYETANGLAADLRRHLNNEPVVARPPSTVYGLQKAWRRNKLAFMATGAVVAALAVGMGLSSWQAIEASRARNAEKAHRLTAQMERDKAQAAEKTEKQARQRADHLLYVANMNLAQQAWEENNVGRVRQLLDDTAAYPECGFEWYYWQRQTHLEIKTLRGHSARVWSVAYCPDGQRIVTGSLDHTAKVWDASNGQEILTLKGHSGGINSVCYSPDGQRIVTGADDRTAKVWEAASGKELLIIQGHKREINHVAFSPDGQRIVTASDDRTARLWNAANGQEILTLKGHSSGINTAAFSPDGKRIVTAGQDFMTKVWDAVSGSELLTLQGHGDIINAAAFSPDSQRIVTGSDDRTAKVWNAVSGKELLTLKGHRDKINCVAFAPDGQMIVTGGRDQTARVWEAASGRELFALKGHSAGLSSVAFSPDGRRIVTSSRDQTARIWETGVGQEPLTLRGHTAGIGCLALSPDGRRIVTGSGDRTAKVWEVASGRELLTLRGHGSGINSVAFAPDGQRIVTGSGDQTARIWEAASGQELLTLKGKGGVVYSVAFSPDGQRIVTGTFDQTARVWDAASGKELLTLKAHSRPIDYVAFSADGQRIVTGSLDQTARVWDVAVGRELLLLKGKSGAIYSVAFSPNGQRILTGSEDDIATVWEAANGRELLSLRGHNAGINAAVFSADGQRIVTGSSDQTAKLWDLASGRELLSLKGHSARINAVAISADGHRIVTGSSDQTAKVWEAATVQEVAVWQDEKRVEARHLAAIERERAASQERQRTARARDSIKQWLILAPIPLASSAQSGSEGLEAEQIEGEGQLRPKAEETRSIGNSKLKWRKVTLEDYVIDFNAIVGQVTDHCVAYAVCYIRSESDHRGLQMLVCSDDQAKVYLNGKQVHKYPFARLFLDVEDIVTDLALNEGLNVLIFKVVNELGEWKGSVRFADPLGNAVKGIQVTLDPDAQN